MISLKKDYSEKKIINFIILTIVGSWSFSIVLSYFIGVNFISSIGQAEVTTKFVTALTIFCVTISQKFKKDWIFSFLFYVCLFTFSSYYFNNLPPAFLPLFENADAVKTIKGDIPSWFTLIVILLFVLEHHCKNKYIIISILFITVFALIGHLIDQPLLYYYVEGKITGMASPTAIMLLHLAIYKLLN